MAEIVTLGAGLGGIPMALEMKEHLRPSDKLTVICNMDTYQFIQSMGGGGLAGTPGY